MPEQPKKKRPTDLNQLAKSIVDEAAGEDTEQAKEESRKNTTAVELGHLGGLTWGESGEVE